MDPHMLVGVVNTAIRNHTGDFEELCASEGLERDVLETRLKEAGYEYLPEQRQFR